MGQPPLHGEAGGQRCCHHSLNPRWVLRTLRSFLTPHTPDPGAGLRGCHTRRLRQQQAALSPAGRARVRGQGCSLQRPWRLPPALHFRRSGTLWPSPGSTNLGLCLALGQVFLS